MSRWTILGIAGLCGLLVLAPASGGAVERQAAVFVVNQAIQDGMAAFAGKKLPREEMRRTAERLITRYADRQQLSATVVGRYWARASAADQAKFQAIVIDYMVAFWGAELADISKDQKITVTGSEPQGDHVLVHSISTEPNESPTAIDWLVGTSADGHPVILDVVGEGVSPIKTMHDDFSAVLRANGGRLDLLTEAMQKKIDAAAASK